MTTGKTEELPTVEEALKEAERLRFDWPVCSGCLTDEKHRDRYAAQVNAELKIIALADEVLKLRATQSISLEREVISAAKEWRHDKTFKSDKKLFAAVEALESHEAKQKNA